jgi:hypothetical protein
VPFPGGFAAKRAEREENWATGAVRRAGHREPSPPATSPGGLLAGNEQSHARGRVADVPVPLVVGAGRCQPVRHGREHPIDELALGLLLVSGGKRLVSLEEVLEAGGFVHAANVPIWSREDSRVGWRLMSTRPAPRAPWLA